MCIRDRFQYERMCDIGEAQNFRVELARYKCDEMTARKYAVKSTFERVVIFGLGTTGLFIGDQIRRNQKDANILFVARSDESSAKARFVKEELHCDYLSTNGLTEQETAKAITDKIGGTATVFIGTSGTEIEHRIAFEQNVLGCNGIYNSFSLGPKVTYNTMPFGFKNQVILASINFTQKHMETAIKLLCDSKFDRLVELIDKDEFTKNPIDAYENKIYSKGAPLKTAVIWNKNYIDEEK